MARKRFSDEYILNLLRQIELSLASGSDVQITCRSAGVSVAIYYKWRKRYVGNAGAREIQEINNKLERIENGLGIKNGTIGRRCKCSRFPGFGASSHLSVNKDGDVEA